MPASGCDCNKRLRMDMSTNGPFHFDRGMTAHTIHNANTTKRCDQNLGGKKTHCREGGGRETRRVCFFVHFENSIWNTRKKASDQINIHVDVGLNLCGRELLGLFDRRGCFRGFFFLAPAPQTPSPPPSKAAQKMAPPKEPVILDHMRQLCVF